MVFPIAGLLADFFAHRMFFNFEIEPTLTSRMHPPLVIVQSAKLREFPGLVEHVRTDKPSTDIFGKPNWCAEWRKVN